MFTMSLLDATAGRVWVELSGLIGNSETHRLRCVSAGVNRCFIKVFKTFEFRMEENVVGVWPTVPGMVGPQYVMDEVSRQVHSMSLLARLNRAPRPQVPPAPAGADAGGESGSSGGMSVDYDSSSERSWDGWLI